MYEHLRREHHRIVMAELSSAEREKLDALDEQDRLQALDEMWVRRERYFAKYAIERRRELRERALRKWKENPPPFMTELSSADREKLDALDEQDRLQALEELAARHRYKWDQERDRVARQQGGSPENLGATKPSINRPRGGISARVPRDADDFEEVVAEWLRRCGVDAKRTPKGSDGGLDVVGGGYAGQCKFHPSSTVGSPDIQRLFGAAHKRGNPIFFHFGPGYTDMAKLEAKRLDVSLWEFDVESISFRQVS